MLRFIAWTWNPDDERQCERARAVRRKVLASGQRWRPVFDHTGLCVASFSERVPAANVLALGDRAGVLLGTAFTSTGRPQNQFVPLSASRLADLTPNLQASAGRGAIESVWGSYVLMLVSAKQRSVVIVRGPMGYLPCFYAHLDGICVFFSELEDFASLELMRLTINWACIRAQVSQQDYLTRETAVTEVMEMVSGECIEIRRGEMSRKLYWNPCEVAKSRVIESFDEASAGLRSLTLACVNAWASGYESVLLTLSGGIDSSIVLGCLAQAPSRPRVTCLNKYSISSDERRFARGMADKWHVDLVERRRDENVDLSTFLSCARTARPVLDFSACDTWHVTAELARKTQARALFDGELGDNLFGSGLGCEVMSEYVARYGWRMRALDVALDLAHLGRLSVWSVLREGLRLYLATKHRAYWSADVFAHSPEHHFGKNLLITEEAFADYRRSMRRFIHPWLEAVVGVPQGKFLLLYGMLVITSTSYHAPFSSEDRAETISPLMSQPIVEHALRIASHLHVSGGHNRAVARHAFAPELSELVVSRRGKCSPSGWIQSVVDRNRDFLREMLLDGILVQERILDASKVERLLSREISRSTIHIAQVFVQLYVESWLRRWVGSPSIRARAELGSGPR
jgi:asparagine synthase (glutamine-hydrolysing)